jgi:hypothetical protein
MAAAGSAADELIGERRVGGSNVVDAQDCEESAAETRIGSTSSTLTSPRLRDRW